MAGGERLTYAELEAASARTARRLAAQGVRSGDRVATTLSPGPELVALVHALPKLGAVLVPLNTRLTAGERRWQLEDSQPRVLVEEPPAGEEADAALADRVDPAGPHSLLYTSGTTGRPKPVELTYANHHASALASAWNLGVAPHDRWLCVLPLFHVGGLAILLRSVIHGTTAVVHDGFDPDAAAVALSSEGVTLVSLVPTMLRRLAVAGLSDAPGLRAALLGGAPPPADLLEWARERRIPVLITYGMTETASQIATASPGEDSPSRPYAEKGSLRAGRSSLGEPPHQRPHAGMAAWPLPGVELRTGAGGEILVRGPMVSPSAVDADGWLRTGDRGRIDDDGRLWVEGRVDEIIVTGGEKVAAREVEEALLVHPAVAEAAAVGRPDPEWGEAVTAYVVLVSAASDAELMAHCRARLAAFKAPKDIRVVAGLPRNATGKVVRGALGA